MSSEVFDAKFLAEKLSKLNNSQQSIESLSRLCISHRNEAKQIVETWEKMFKSSSKEQCVSFLYLANDVLQNSKKNGSEFVNEFWKVLPAALKHVYDNGDEKTATRLVNIWEERKVFGSRIQSLKDELVVKQGKVPHTQTVSKGKSTIKTAKKEPLLLRVKLAVGGFPEKIVSAYHSVRDECSNEDSDVAKCSSAALSMEKIVKDFESAINQGLKPGSGIADEMQEQENALQQCVKQLEQAEASRIALVALLKEALLDQETKLESLRGQLQIAHDRISDVENLKPKLTILKHAVSAAGIGALTETPNVVELPKLGIQTGSTLQAPSSQPVTTLQIPGHQVPQAGSALQVPPSQPITTLLTPGHQSPQAGSAFQAPPSQPVTMPQIPGHQVPQSGTTLQPPPSQPVTTPQIPGHEVPQAGTARQPPPSQPVTTVQIPGHQIPQAGSALQPPPSQPVTTLQIPGNQVPQAGSGLQAPSSQPVLTRQIPGHQVPLPPGLPTTTFAAVVTSNEESKKAQAAAVAAKLAASTSSVQMLASVLSSLAAEQTASMNDPLRKRQKVGHPSSGVDVTGTDPDNSPYFNPLRQPVLSTPVSQANQIPGSVGPPPPPPPLPPPMMPSNSGPNQFVQSLGMMSNMVPFGFGGNGLPPLQPVPSHLAMGLARPLNPPGSQPLRPPHPQNPTGGYYQPPDMGLYAPSSQSSTPPVQRQ